MLISNLDCVVVVSHPPYLTYYWGKNKPNLSALQGLSHLSRFSIILEWWTPVYLKPSSPGIGIKPCTVLDSKLSCLHDYALFRSRSSLQSGIRGQHPFRWIGGPMPGGDLAQDAALSRWHYCTWTHSQNPPAWSTWHTYSGHRMTEIAHLMKVMVNAFLRKRSGVVDTNIALQIAPQISQRIVETFQILRNRTHRTLLYTFHIIQPKPSWQLYIEPLQLLHTISTAKSKCPEQMCIAPQHLAQGRLKYVITNTNKYIYLSSTSIYFQTVRNILKCKCWRLGAQATGHRAQGTMSTHLPHDISPLDGLAALNER